MILGNDISSHQGNINFDTLVKNCNFLIIKSSEGVGFTDPKFTRNQLESRRVGLPLGYYHFARPDLNNEAEKEAEWFVKTVEPFLEGEIFCLDYEANWHGDVVGWCKRFLDKATNLLNGCKPLIYLNQSHLSTYDWKPIVESGYGLWLAAYTYDPYNNNFKTAPWKFSAMQQWTNQQKVPGIIGNVDGNVFFGDIKAFKKYGYQPPNNQPPVVKPTVTMLQEEYEALQTKIKELSSTVERLTSQMALYEEECQAKMLAQRKELVQKMIDLTSKL